MARKEQTKPIEKIRSELAAAAEMMEAEQECRRVAATPGLVEIRLKLAQAEAQELANRETRARLAASEGKQSEFEQNYTANLAGQCGTMPPPPRTAELQDAHVGLVAAGDRVEKACAVLHERLQPVLACEPPPSPNGSGCVEPMPYTSPAAQKFYEQASRLHQFARMLERIVERLEV